jgi:hypothetical protein
VFRSAARCAGIQSGVLPLPEADLRPHSEGADMKRTVMMAAAMMCCAGTAMSGPTFTNKQGPVTKSRPVQLGGPDVLPFSDNFDSYVSGSGLAGQGGWEKWAAAAVDATVSSTQSSSPSNSLKMVPQTDIIQQGNITSGKWELNCMTFYPSTNVGPGAGDGGFIIGLNRFLAGGVGMTNDMWSSQVQWHPGTLSVRNADLLTESTPIVANSWVPFRMVIDLATDKYDAFYNGIQFITQRAWSTGVFTPGQVSIGCFDFYGGNLAATLPFEMYFDSITLTQVTSCYANCDGVGGLTANDFICFVTAFNSGASYANCDATGGLTANDFICFLTAYNNGCT